MTFYRPDNIKDSAQLAYEQRRNARRDLRSYVQECRTQWPSLTEAERELCREAVRTLAERAGISPSSGRSM